MLNLLRSEIFRTVNAYCDRFSHREPLLQTLARPGFALHPEGPCRAGLLTLNVYHAIQGSLSEAALKAAAAVELHMEAAYLFDDLADQELDTGAGRDAAEELSLAIALLTCGAASAGEATYQANLRESGLESLRQFHYDCLGSCSGQFLDAHLKKRRTVTCDEALQMTLLKSGSIGRCVTGFGARMATDDPVIVELFGEFGVNLFTYLQLADDLRDACPKQGPLTDLMQYKKTLPLVFFYNFMAERHPQWRDVIMHHQFLAQSCQEVRQEFAASGAEVFSAITAETFLNRAKRNLAVLEQRLGTLQHLEQALTSFEINPEELFAVV